MSLRKIILYLKIPDDLQFFYNISIHIFMDFPKIKVTNPVAELDGD